MNAIRQIFVAAAPATLAGLLGACSAQTDSAPFSAAATKNPMAVASPAAPFHHNAHKRRGWIDREVLRITRYVYAADGDVVLIFPEKPHNPKPIGQISDGVDSAYGLWVDRDKNLYVANQYNDTVTAYHHGATSPFRTYTQGLARPLYPIVDAAGDLWVGNANGGAIVEYGAGGTKVKQTLQTDGSEADGMDFDAQGDLFVAYRNGSSGSIDEFQAGSKHPKSLGMSLNSPQSVVVTKSGTILTVETNGVDRIDVFPPGYTVPTLEVGVRDIPTELALTSTEHNLFVSSLKNADIYLSLYPLLNPNGSPNVLHEKIDVGPYGNGNLQGMALNYGQVF